MIEAGGVVVTTPAVEALAAWVGVLVVLLTGTAYLWKRLRHVIKFADALERLVAKVDAIEAVVSKELEPNTGDSMKDDLHGVAMALGHLQRHVGDLDAQLQDHLNLTTVTTTTTTAPRRADI